MMSKIAMLLFLAVVAFGCHAQVPPSNHTVQLSWTAPQATGSWAGCTTANPCSYVISRATVASGATSYPGTAGTSYTPLNQSSPATETSFTDSGASGTTDCYIAQTIQGSAVSLASNAVGPLVVPANPLAPALKQPITAENAEPVLPLQPAGQEVAESVPLRLTVSLR